MMESASERNVGSRRAIWTAAVVLLTLGLLGGFALRRLAPAPLLSQATPILLPIQLSRDTYGCTWLNDETVLLHRSLPSGIGLPLLLNIRTGQTNDLPGLRLALESDDGPATLSWYQLSPDRKRLLVFCDTGTNQQIIAVTTDGKERRVWNREFEAVGFTWLPDSRHWVQFLLHTQPGKARVYSVDSEETREFATSLTDYVRATRWTPDGNLLLQCSDPRVRQSGYRDVTFVKVSGSNFALCGTPWRAKFPVAIDVNPNSWIFSPDGTRLAGEYINTRPWKLWLRRLPWLRTLDSDWARGAGLWVSRADGSRFRMLGRTPTGEYAQAPSWMPGGRYLSFLHWDTNKNVTLWKIPVK